jgi:hypothetical protein
VKSAFLALSLCLASAAATAQVLSFPHAVQDYRAGRFSSAYGRFVELANHGHPEAARIALFMYKNGELLYRAQWDASEDEVDAWSTLAKARHNPSLVVEAKKKKAELKVAEKK